MEKKRQCKAATSETLPERVEQDQTQIALLAEAKRLIDKHGPLTFFHNGRLVSKDDQDCSGVKQVIANCKIGHPNAALDLIKAATPANGGDSELGAAVTKITALEPSNYIEALLAAQIIAVEEATSTMMKRALNPLQPPVTTEQYTKLSIKLQRTLLLQMETYQKLKGKVGQKVTVEHVTVQSGGQAVVGNIEHRGGNNEKDK